jgi:DNA-binding response OmpR family regulator
MTARVLVVDDEPSTRESLADALSEQGLSVRLADVPSGAPRAAAASVSS